MSVQYWTTTNIKQVLDDSYNRGVNGADYEELVPELQDELWRRQLANDEKELKKRLKEMEMEELSLTAISQ